MFPLHATTHKYVIYQKKEISKPCSSVFFYTALETKPNAFQQKGLYLPFTQNQANKFSSRNKIHPSFFPYYPSNFLQIIFFQKA
jgi:hypothetical protein